MGTRPVANPDLQGGASHPDPEIRGGGGIGNFPVSITAGGVSAGQLWIKVMHFL